MLALQRGPRHRGRCTPSVLPCRVDRNGRVHAATRYWNPVVSGTPPAPALPARTGVPRPVPPLPHKTHADGTKTAYFRGRKLHGKTLALPPSHRGVVASATERVLPAAEPAAASGKPAGAEEEGQEPEPEPEVKIVEERASFDEVVVWGHEVLPDGMADPYVRGLEDWIAFAAQIHEHGHGPEEEKTE
ncbi:hypothetical protein B2J93_3823 [Marssonina coronariae]|uniref:Uncharacterized protein n=1 Tax=Diplocarpon coronariae TaxID=2795749 RepID=A0A218ZFN7_9HELO|nr:hypothetical protein B2J93_3823 [Marssonina coronariae]